MSAVNEIRAEWHSIARSYGLTIVEIDAIEATFPTRSWQTHWEQVRWFLRAGYDTWYIRRWFDPFGTIARL